jgi:hypothetical protein
LDSRRPLKQADTLARFLFSERHEFSRKNNKLKSAAFKLQYGRRGVSTFRISALSEREIWRHGDMYVASERGKPVLARGDLEVHTIQQFGLTLEMTKHPPRHVDITGWSTESRDLLARQQLADKARLWIRP